MLRGGRACLDTVPCGGQPPLDAEASDEGLLTMVQSTTCRRKIGAEVFDSLALLRKLPSFSLFHENRLALAEPLTVPCCDICDPTLLDRTRPGPRLENAQGKGRTIANSFACKQRQYKKKGEQG